MNTFLELPALAQAILVTALLWLIFLLAMIARAEIETARQNYRPGDLWPDGLPDDRPQWKKDEERQRVTEFQRQLALRKKAR